MLGAGARLTAGADPPLLGHIPLEHLGLLVVDDGRLLGAELTEAWTADKPPAATVALVGGELLLLRIQIPRFSSQLSHSRASSRWRL